MHIAICDDNGADRKQLERLLKRESDRRAADTGVLYIDSYGNAQALLANPLQYDIFYLDMCHTPGVTVSGIIEGLTAKGVRAPIVLCCSLINYREQSFPENIIFLDKAIRVADLSESIDHALAIKAQAPSMIELREENDTLYVTEEEILYAVAKGRVIDITLTEGRIFHTRTDILNLYSQWRMHGTFFCPSGSVIVNSRHLKEVRFLQAQMGDGKTFLLPPSLRPLAEEMKAEYSIYP